MQSESNESSHIPNPANTSEPSNASQYGFHTDQLRSAEAHDPFTGQQHDSPASIDAGDVATSRLDDVFLSERLQGLNVNDGLENRPKPSFQRISEYENALSPSPPRRQNEGPAFKVIKKKGGKNDGPKLDEFPNGMVSSYTIQLAI